MRTATRISAQHHSLSQARHPKTKRFVKQRTNGNSNGNGATISTPIAYGLQRILRPQAAFRWILPNLAAITPQYIEMILRGALAGNHVQQWELFDLMFDTWPELSACHQELVYGVLRKKLIYEPAHEEDEQPSPEALDRHKLVSTALRRMEPSPERDDNALDGTIKDILDAWFRGVAVSEVIWHIVDDKQVGTIAAPKSTFWVHPVCFAFNADGVLGLRAVKPQSSAQWPYPSSTLAAQPQPAQLEPFPPYKFLIAIHKAKSGTALGGPLLRPLAWWWCASNFSSDWLLNLAQLFGLPFRYATHDVNASKQLVDQICNMLQNMGTAGWAVFPQGTEIEFMQPNKEGSDHSPQGELLDRADRYARLLILGQTMTGTHGTMGKGGGQAFGKVEKGIKEDRIDAAGKFAASVINRQLINSILMLNYGDTEEAPHIKFLEDEVADLTEAQRDATLAKAGLPIGVDYLRKKYDIPEPAEGEETIGGQPEMPQGFGGFNSSMPPDTENPAETQVPTEESESADQAKAKAIAAAGDLPGHEFHGNQYTEGLRNLGVEEIDLPRNKMLNQMALDAVKKVKDAGYSVPRRITSKIFESRAIAFASGDALALTKGRLNVEDLQRSVDSGFLSQSNPVLHEIGHLQHERSAGTNSYDQMSTWSYPEVAKPIASKVSRYAATNPKEFVAETFAGHLSGKQYPEDVLSLYDRHRGPKLQ